MTAPDTRVSVQRQLREVVAAMPDPRRALDSLVTYATGGATDVELALWEALADGLGAPFESRAVAMARRLR